MRTSLFPCPLVLAISALLCGTPARAQTPEGPYPYMGFGVGQARAGIDAARLGAAALGNNELAISGTSRDERDTAYKLFGGLQFNRFIAVEAGYSRLGKFGYQALTTPTGQLDGRLKLQGLSLDLVGSLPLGERLSALARAGYQRTRTNADWSGSGAAANVHRSARANDSAPRYGIGLQYAFTPQFFLRAEAERSRFADAQGGTVRVSVYSASVVMPFGSAPMSAPRAAYAPPEPPRATVEPAPAPVAITTPAPPPPAPAPAPASAPVPLRRVSFSAESLFGFDSAELRLPGKAALDTFAGELAGTRYDSIAVTGHTDRLGSTAYNQALSLKRADAVKSYLVSSARLDAAGISAEGLSESQPVTQPDDCKGKSSPRVIACLQPDRRVEIKVSGTR